MSMSSQTINRGRFYYYQLKISPLFNYLLPELYSAILSSGFFGHTPEEQFTTYRVTDLDIDNFQSHVSAFVDRLYLRFPRDAIQLSLIVNYGDSNSCSHPNCPEGFCLQWTTRTRRA
jgi:hypothetical protein